MKLRRAMTSFAAIVSVVGVAWAHDLVPPRPADDQPTARWPDGVETAHDVVVPIILTISADGHVTDVIIDASLGDAFDAAAIVAARRWRFQPATSEGKPIASKIRAVIRFVAKQPAPAPKPPPEKPPTALPPQAPPHAAPVEVVGHSQADHHHPHDVRVVGDRREPTRSASDVTLTRPTLTAAPHKTAADLLQSVPGVAIVQHGGDGKAFQIFFRGFDAEHGQDIEVWAGGAPVNDVSNLHGQGYADLHFVPPELVREVRSTPGTYDPRQGDFAVAGTLRLTLGYDQPGVTMKAQAGSFGARRTFAAYRPKAADEASFAAFESYVTSGFGPARAASRTSALAQGAWDVADATRLRLMLSTYASRFDSAGVLLLRDIETRRVDRYGSYDQDQGGASARTQLVIDLASADEGERWRIAPFLVVRSLRLRQDFTGYLEDETNGRATQQENDAWTIGANAHLNQPLRWFSARDAIEVGIYARSDTIEQSQSNLAIGRAAVTGEPVRAKIRATNAAGYVDLALSPVRWLMMRGGIRQDGLAYAVTDTGTSQGSRSAQGAHLGKKGSVEATVARNASIVASYGEGFRSPQARSLSNGEQAPFTTVRSYEVGARYRDRNTLRASLALFRSELSDDLAFDPETTRTERTPGTSRTGVAADVFAEPRTWLSTAVSATYTRAVFRSDDGGHKKGDFLPYAPQLVVRSDVAARPELGTVGGRTLKGRVGYGFSMLHKRPLPFGETAHDVFLVDASAALRLGEVELGCDVYNLLGAQTYDGEYSFSSAFQRGGAPSLLPQRHVTVGAPRAWLANVTLYL